MTTEMPTSAELDAHFHRFRSDARYLNSIWTEVKKDYPDQYVAVYDGEIVATHRNLKKLIAALKGKGLPPNHTHIRFAHSKPRVLVV